MITNLGWATGYKTVANPLAAGFAVGAWLTLFPAVGTVFISASTVVVSINAMLLRRAPSSPREND